jgi:hypothetical protein
MAVSARQEGGCVTGSLVSSAAESPSVDRAIPRRGRRETCNVIAFSSIASAMIVDSDTPRLRLQRLKRGALARERRATDLCVQSLMHDS